MNLREKKLFQSSYFLNKDLTIVGIFLNAKVKLFLMKRKCVSFPSYYLLILSYTVAINDLFSRYYSIIS